jgi:hypothetical protein
MVAVVAKEQSERWLIWVLIALAAILLFILIYKKDPYHQAAPGENVQFKKVEEYSSNRGTGTCPPPSQGFKLITDRQGRVVGVQPG